MVCVVRVIRSCHRYSSAARASNGPSAQGGRGPRHNRRIAASEGRGLSSKPAQSATMAAPQFRSDRDATNRTTCSPTDLCCRGSERPATAARETLIQTEYASFALHARKNGYVSPIIVPKCAGQRYGSSAQSLVKLKCLADEILVVVRFHKVIVPVIE